MGGRSSVRDADDRPLILGLGGTARPDSSSERALRIALGHAEEAGAATLALTALELELPAYRPGEVSATAAVELLDRVRAADGLIIATPGYHGGMSGLLKNALDYLEELADDDAPYLSGRAVGCIVCAAGWQSTATTLVSLRSMVHALRGWPTPLGVAINSADPALRAEGFAVGGAVHTQLGVLSRQVLDFARLTSTSPLH
jgi:FMN reductase